MEDIFSINVVFEVPISEYMERKINKKINFGFHHSYTRPILFNALKKKYQKVLQNKNWYVKHIDRNIHVKVEGYYFKKDLKELFHVFDGMITENSGWNIYGYTKQDMEEKVKKMLDDD